MRSCRAFVPRRRSRRTRTIVESAECDERGARRVAGADARGERPRPDATAMRRHLARAARTVPSAARELAVVEHGAELAADERLGVTEDRLDRRGRRTDPEVRGHDEQRVPARRDELARAVQQEAVLAARAYARERFDRVEVACGAVGAESDSV